MNLIFKKSIFLELLRYPEFVTFVRSTNFLDVPDNISDKTFQIERLKSYKVYLNENIALVENLIEIFLQNNPVFWGIVLTINNMAAEYTIGHASSFDHAVARERLVMLKLDIIYDLIFQAKLPNFDVDHLKHRFNCIASPIKSILAFNFKDHVIEKLADTKDETILNLYSYAFSIANRYLVTTKQTFLAKLATLMNTENVLKDYFDRVVVINLDRRKDRWEALQHKLSEINWPFKEPERFSAYDGSRLPIPVGWTSGQGTWGCLLSHREVLARALQDRLQSILILEDDIFFAPNFEERVLEFIKGVPSDWHQLMLGGQYFDDTKVYDISPGIRKVSLCHRAHAYAVRSTFMSFLYSKLCSSYGHVDHIFNTFQDRFNVYTPRYFLIGQDGSPSDISGMQASPDLLRNPPDSDTPVFLIAPDIDLHRQVIASDLPLHFGALSETGTTKLIYDYAHNPIHKMEANIHAFLISSIWYARSVYPAKFSTILNPEGLILDRIMKAKGSVNLIYIESMEQLREAVAKYAFNDALPTQFPEEDKAP